jgi:hypothetical protein
MTEIRACCPTPEASPHVPSCPEHVPPQGRQRPSKVTMVVRDTETGEDIELSGTRDVPIPEFLGSPDAVWNTDPGGVWLVWFMLKTTSASGELQSSNVTGHAVFPDEVDALRYAVTHGYKVAFLPYGKTVYDAVQASLEGQS